MRFVQMKGFTYKYGYQCTCGYRKPIPIPEVYDHLQHESIEEKEARLWRKEMEEISSNILNISGGKPKKWGSNWGNFGRS